MDPDSTKKVKKEKGVKRKAKKAAKKGKKAAVAQSSGGCFEVPSVKDDEFNEWFDYLDEDEFIEAWEDEKVRKSIKSRIRHPGGLHEWLMCARADKFKSWGVSMDEIKEHRSEIKDVKFVNPPGKHGGPGSTEAHNEILAIIDKASSYEEFKKELREWAKNRLKGGVNSLPEGLRK